MIPRNRNNSADSAARPFCTRTFCKTFAIVTMIGGSAVWIAASASENDPTLAATIAVELDIESPRIVIVKSARMLYLFEGDQLVRTYSVTLGPKPAGQKVRSGDGRTPEGKFRICTKNADSPNRRFLGISYPDRAATLRGLREGLVSSGEAAAILRALDDKRCPSWATGLGGGIGLHGAGGENGRTAGCIALTDEDVDELFSVLRIGDQVEILP
jgi:murein L,D-transpeptidase YafK